MARSIRTEGLVDAERLRETLHHLREAGEKGITKAQLARKLGGVATRTVDRALGLLEAQGARILRSRAGRPPVLVFQLAKGPAWDEHVTPEARLALRLAALTLGQSGTLLWQEKLEALERLASAHMSTRDRALFDTLQQAVRVQGGVEDPIEGPEVLEPILRALEADKALELDYQAPGRSAGKVRTVAPHALTHDLYSGGAFLLVWDFARRKPLHLRLARIGKAKVVALPAPLPKEAPAMLARAATYQVGGWTSEDLPFEVVVRIDGAHWVQALKEAPPALPDFEVRIAPGADTLEARFKATHPAGASRWILQFGEAAEVLAPEWLRDDLRKRLEAALRAYR
ncbi:MAG TPA: WYL domain-containing protein [Holophaga sp.]|nr:WYL domain-containing protein [Holophaga sp.]